MYGLLGKTLKHSFSKDIHEKLQKKSYEFFEIEDLNGFFTNVPFQGINVTIPYKQTVIPFLDEISTIANNLQSVNTIVRNGTRLIGYNTDYDGLCFTLDHYQISLKDKTIFIMGNGATSRLIQYVAKEQNAKEIFVFSRHPNHNEYHFDLLSTITNPDIIFNATPVGMFPNNDDTLNIPFELYKNLTTVFDLIYNPLRSNFLLEAENMGIKAINGLLMLVHQAVRASELFHNKTYPVGKTLQIYTSLYMKLSNFVLIGMPTSGKTTYASKLSSKYNKDFIDIDYLIETDAKMQITAIFEQFGESKFRALETRYTKESSLKNNVVISTGGGIILNHKNMDYLKQNGIIIFLDVPLSNLLRHQAKNRPLLKNKEDMENLYNDRYPLYKKYADITISKDVQNFDTILKRIEVAINEYTRA